MQAPNVAHELAAGRVSIVTFDLLALEEIPLTRARSWRYRRDILETIFADGRRSCEKSINRDFANLIPCTTDHKKLWAEWVEKRKGEGIVLKRTDSLYIPGARLPTWIKFKDEITIDVVIAGLCDKPRNGNSCYKRGEAALTYGFWNPERGRDRPGLDRRIARGARPIRRARLRDQVPGNFDYDSFKSSSARWRDDKAKEECIREEVTR